MSTFGMKGVRPFIRPTQITEGLNVNGIVTGQSFHEAFGNNDFTKIGQIEAVLFSSTNHYNGKMLIGMTEAKGNIKKIPTNGFRWDISAAESQTVTITKVMTSDKYMGANLESAEICVDKPYFSISDIIIPNDENYRWLVKARENGKNYTMLSPNQYVYTIKLTTNDPDKKMLSSLAALNQQWRKVSSAVADEDNQDGGGFQFYSVYQSEGTVQQHAKKIALSDKAARLLKHVSEGKADVGTLIDPAHKQATQALWFKVGTNKETKQPVAKFLSLFEANMTNALYQDVENTLLLGQASNSQTSAEGYIIHTASGLREILKGSHSLPHNGNLDLQTLEKWILSVVQSKIPMAQRKIVLTGGTEFARMFDRMVKNETSQFMTLDTMYIRKGDDYRHLDYGSYFYKYMGLNVEIMVTINEAYDNKSLFPTLDLTDPSTTLMSYTGDVLDFTGDANASSNIMMVEQDMMNYHITYNGKWKGFDGKTALPITDGSAGIGGGVSGFTVLKEKSAGLMVVDPSRCGTTYKEQYDASLYIPSTLANDWVVI